MDWKVQNYCFIVILNKIKGDIAFPRAGGVNDGGFAVLLHHCNCALVGFCIVLVQVQSHSVHPSFLGLRGIFHFVKGGYLLYYINYSTFTCIILQNTSLFNNRIHH